MAVTVTVAETVAPLEGVVIETVGAVVSLLVTVALAWFEAPLRFPAASSALTT